MVLKERTLSIESKSLEMSALTFLSVAAPPPLPYPSSGVYTLVDGNNVVQDLYEYVTHTRIRRCK